MHPEDNQDILLIQQDIEQGACSPKGKIRMKEGDRRYLDYVGSRDNFECLGVIWGKGIEF